MTGAELKAVRIALGLTRRDFAAELGYCGGEKGLFTQMRRYEEGHKEIPLYIARLVWLLDQYWKVCGCLPDWPREACE